MECLYIPYQLHAYVTSLETQISSYMNIYAHMHGLAYVTFLIHKNIFTEFITQGKLMGTAKACMQIPPEN